MKIKSRFGVKTQVSNAGFTLMELIVVMAIMGTILGLTIANFSGQKATRNLNIGQNELVTNLRKIQSYTLSSRTINGNQAVQYYIAKFDMTTPDRYYLQAIYNASSAPVLQTIETIKFPTGVKLAASSTPLSIGGTSVSSGCALLAFKLPYGKSIMSDGCAQNGWNPNTDNYRKILNFVANTPGGTTYANSDMDIKINFDQGLSTRTVTVKGLTGTITFQ